MKEKEMTRRDLITTMSAVAAGRTSVAQSPVRCRILDHRGEPVEPAALDRFHICDLVLRPSPIDPKIAPGEVFFQPPGNPFRISVPLRVPGFGHVFLYADDRGAGYTRARLARPGPILLNYEFAADRLATVTRMSEEHRASGVAANTAVQQRMASARELLRKAETQRSDEPACARLSMESLRESLWAGEILVLEAARHRIARQGPRPGFLFGCYAPRFARGADWYRKYMTELVDYVTVPVYRSLERTKGQPDYSRLEDILKALQGTGLIIKGHPLIWLFGRMTPDWLKNLPFPETKALCLSRVMEAVTRLRDRIHTWDVINEAHVHPDSDSMAGFTREQNVELTVDALRAARNADPTCFRIVNNTGTWSDYYMGRKPAVGQQSVYDYLAMVRDAGGEYEALGLQYYHSGRDMLEFERNLDSFQAFKKPVHVTELGIASSSAEVRNAEWWGGGLGGARLVWHGEEFTETSQADWYEQVYTLAYSKPWVQAITSWDFTDPGFMPHGGLLTSDGKPKESYERLKGLLRKWRERS
jgi:endo-1,4-beta-xylanase